MLTKYEQKMLRDYKRWLEERETELYTTTIRAETAENERDEAIFQAEGETSHIERERDEQMEIVANLRFGIKTAEIEIKSYISLIESVQNERDKWKERAIRARGSDIWK